VEEPNAPEPTVPRFCPRGHRIVFSTGRCSTIVELGGRYRYFDGDCDKVVKLIAIAESLCHAKASPVFP
jgi:hypothetical protein